VVVILLPPHPPPPLLWFHSLSSLLLRLLSNYCRHGPLTLLRQAKLIITSCSCFLSSTSCTELVTQYKSKYTHPNHTKHIPCIYMIIKDSVTSLCDPVSSYTHLFELYIQTYYILHIWCIRYTCITHPCPAGGLLGVVVLLVHPQRPSGKA
jgi:hypothetical protein